MSKKSTYEEYEEYVNQYKKEYGDRVVVFYRCGSFYEIYSAGDDIINMKEISELLNIQITRKNKSKIDVNKSNYNMAGFPMVALKKFVNILVAANYTVVIVDQVAGPPRTKRAVTEVISPGTKIDDTRAFDTNVTLLVTFEEFEIWKSKKQLLSVGVALIDLTTGKSKIVEYYSTEADPNLAIDELYKLLLCCTPKEIILTSSKELLVYSFSDLISYLDLGKTYVHDRIAKYPIEMTKLAYQEQALRKIFPNHGLLSVFEYLNLERMHLATLSFVYVLDFCYKHNSEILRNLTAPETLTAANTCELAFNSSKQLNIDSLCVILNKCQTAMGRRVFKERLLNPLNDSSKIKQKYDKLDKFIEIYKELTGKLCNIYDLERLSRKISLQKLHPADIIQITTTLETTLEINKLIKLDELVEIKTNALLTELKTTFDLKKIQKYHLDNISESLFNKGIFLKIDSLQEEFENLHSILTKLSTEIHPEHIKVEYNERDDYHFVITKKRFSEVNKSHKLANSIFKIKSGKIEYEFKWEEFVTKQISASSTSYKLTSPTMAKINQKINIFQEKLSKKTSEQYQKFIAVIEEKYISTLNILVDYIIDIDWYNSCAHNATELKYCRPQIENKYNGRSYLSAKCLRHPVIEKLLGFQSYIPNDIDVGTDENQGILLYGVNSSGKSSISKAMAICIIMAQAGMYVPCREFTYWPYMHIFTRIPSGDDMMKGQSTFVVEISELRNILMRATENSLVIGDELASGTESISALAIVGAGILQLHTRKASFIFATHLHNLCKINKIISLKTLGIYHLTVRYDPDTDKLIYERILKKGQGNTMYGLEVCKALNLGCEFLNTANQIRHEILGNNTEIFSTKKSKYNANLYVDTCTICKRAAQEVHHIRQQKMADSSGFIDYLHKNNLENLVNICEKCHDDVHGGKIKIEGYRQTSNGIELIMQNS